MLNRLDVLTLMYTCSPRKEDKTEDEKTHDDFGDINSLHSTFLTSVPGGKFCCVIWCVSPSYSLHRV